MRALVAALAVCCAAGCVSTTTRAWLADGTVIHQRNITFAAKQDSSSMSGEYLSEKTGDTIWNTGQATGAEDATEFADALADGITRAVIHAMTPTPISP